MLIDNITIIICIVVLLLTVVSVVANPFFRSVKSNRSYKEEGCELHPLPSLCFRRTMWKLSTSICLSCSNRTMLRVSKLSL